MDLTVYQWLSMLGVPALVASFGAYLHNTLKEIRKSDRATRAGIQAVLRALMVADYNKWSERGYAPIYARENFENCWIQYHSLGANGVMDDIRKKFHALPTEPPQEARNE